MLKYVFDVEFYPNYFEVGFKEFNTDKYVFFEISDYQNDRDKLLNFLKSNHILIGFNSVHYDNLMLTAVIKHPTKTLEHLYKVNNAIINDDYEIVKHYKYKSFKSIDIDLYLYWSRMLRISKKISLKGLP